MAVAGHATRTRIAARRPFVAVSRRHARVDADEVGTVLQRGLVESGGVGDDGGDLDPFGPGRATSASPGSGWFSPITTRLRRAAQIAGRGGTPVN
jgi:hypothetical protein